MTIREFAQTVGSLWMLFRRPRTTMGLWTIEICHKSGS